MLRVFLVPQGLTLTEDLPPTANVLSLQKSLAQRYSVSNKDVILLTGKGQLLESLEILGQYDGGTEERPFFVYFRPGVKPKLRDESVLKRNVQLEQRLSRISASPSHGMLQQQTDLAQEFAREGLKLTMTSSELQESKRLLWSGWLALLHNFSSMLKTFNKHQKNLATVLINFGESLEGYKTLIEKTPEQLELLKRVSLPSFMDRSVFGEETHSLYNWINLQDEHSSLEDLLRECRTALQQVDVKGLEELKQIASKLTGTAEELYQRETQERVSLKGKELDHISKEQKSTSQSLHATVQKALGSGDAGTLASISLSNCQLLKLMNSNHVKLEDSVWELNEERNGMRDRIRSRLQSLAELQQEMTRIDSKLQLYSGQIQLLRRKFEVLEQICAAPHMMSSILEEVRQRKLFRKFFIEEGEKVFRRFEALRQKEKSRRQQFFDKCGQHFVFSLFPSFTDRLPHLMSSVPQKFDEDICSLPTEELNKLLDAFAPSNNHLLREDLSFTCDGCTQTDREGNRDNDMSLNKRGERLVPVMLERGIQTSLDHWDQSVQTQTHTVSETETQTLDTSLNPTTSVGSQTNQNTIEDKSTQVSLMLCDTCTQINIDDFGLMQYDACTQTVEEEIFSRSVGLQTKVSIGLDQTLRIVRQSYDEGIQAKVTTSDMHVQFSPLMSPASTQTFNNQRTTHSQAGSGCIASLDAQVQTNLFVKSVITDTHCQTDTVILRSQSTQFDSQIHIIPDSQTDLSNSNPPFISGDLQGQVVALQAAVEGLQKQLLAEREEHKRQESELERDYKQMRKSMHESQGLPSVISITDLKVGDFALFLTDSRGNYLALSFDERIYYLSHVSAEKFTGDISRKCFTPLRRKFFYGCITEKVLVQVQKETNRLQVPVGQRLYKLSAREMPISEVS